jgi:hypothetical protein
MMTTTTTTMTTKKKKKKKKKKEKKKKKKKKSAPPVQDKNGQQTKTKPDPFEAAIQNKTIALKQRLGVYAVEGAQCAVHVQHLQQRIRTGGAEGIVSYVGRWEDVEEEEDE